MLQNHNAKILHDFKFTAIDTFEACFLFFFYFKNIAATWIIYFTKEENLKKGFGRKVRDQKC